MLCRTAFQCTDLVGILSESVSSSDSVSSLTLSLTSTLMLTLTLTLTLTLALILTLSPILTLILTHVYLIHPSVHVELTPVRTCIHSPRRLPATAAPAPPHHPLVGTLARIRQGTFL